MLRQAPTGSCATNLWLGCLLWLLHQTRIKARALRDIHSSKHFSASPSTHSARLDGLWIAVSHPAHRSAIMAPIQSTEFDLSKCFKGEQQLVYVYYDRTGIEIVY